MVCHRVQPGAPAISYKLIATKNYSFLKSKVCQAYRRIWNLRLRRMIDTWCGLTLR
jgi:hypothetical protein